MKIGIIGGGASGMMLAALLGKDREVTLLERNAKLGKKLLLTGNGKCNFTAYDYSDLDTAYNNDFARNVYKKYDRDSFLSFMREIGVEPKLEYHKGLGYYYPMSNKSTSVYYALYDKIVDNGVKIIYNADVKDIIIDKANNNSFIVKTSDDKYVFDRLVISTGGMSYKNTGSDGSMYNLLEKLGHKIIKPLPGLAGFRYSDADLKKLKGVRVDARAIAGVYKTKGDKETIVRFEEVGEIQFTENYVSGIPIMNLSRNINRLLDSGEDVTLTLNLCDREDLNEYLLERREKLSYRKAEDFLVGMLPDEIADVVLKRSNGNIKSIAEHIRNFTVSDIALGTFDNAQVTLGGVDTKEVDENSMESKIHKNLYFTGEVLDIDGRCGGYNLQLCYSTAVSVCKYIS